MDRSEKKKEGITARNNKFKYKKHIKKEPEKPVQKKNILEEELPSNWAKYEIKDESDEENEGANFETLLDKPLSNSHFKLKNEQDWSNNVELHSQFSKYFTLDLKLLSEGIACLPFSKRHGYDDLIFQTLDEDVSKKLSKYETFLKKKYPTKNTKLNIKTEVVIKNTKKENINEGNETTEAKDDKLEEEVKDDEPEKELINENKKDDVTKIASDIINVKEQRVFKVKKTENKTSDKDLEGLLNLKITEEDNTAEIVITEDPLLAATNVSKNITTNTTEDLEQWLDDILDD